MTKNTRTWTPWIVVLSAALFFFYEFVQLNMFDAINLPLSASFHIDAAQVSRLSAVYFISNVIFLLPAGLLIDRVSTRKLILLTLGISIISTFCFAMSSTMGWAALFHFLAGIGSAFCFLSTIRLASRWFPPTRMALVSGVVVTMAMLGGLFAQAPFTLLVSKLGWRQAVLVDVCLGLVIFVIILIAVRDYPPKGKKSFEQSQKELQGMGFLKSAKLSYLNRQNWLCGIYTSLMNLPIFLLGALWGMPYLIQVHGLNATQASWVISALFMGTIIGCPILGEVSDYLEKRRSLMRLGAVIVFILILALMYAPINSMLFLATLFFSIGFFTSTQVLSYPTVTESNSKARTAMSVSVISFCAISGGAIFQPLFGRLMNVNWDHTFFQGVPVYSGADYHLAFFIMVAGFLIAWLATLGIQETKAKAMEK